MIRLAVGDDQVNPNLPAALAECPDMQQRLEATTSALFECDNCHREVVAIHSNCDRCAEKFPDLTPLQRCEHYVCRRCGEEV